MNLNDRVFSHANADRAVFGIALQQTWASLYMMDRIMASAMGGVKWICEIGTGTGALSLYLGVCGKLRDIPVVTIDILDRRIGRAGEVQSLLDVKQVRGDCFADPFRGELSRLAEMGPGLLIVDGGDKPRELQEFGSLMPTGTVILMHDYGIEWHQDAIDGVSEVEMFEPWHSMSVNGGTRLAILKRK